MNITPTDLQTFDEHPVWREMQQRLAKVAVQVDRDIENPDSFEHGIAVGKRRNLTFLLNLPQQISRELKAGGVVESVRP
jgi:hypothetical protein